MDVAKKILELCEKNNITIYRLADLSGVNQSTIQNIISIPERSPQVATIEKICEGFGITLSEFFDDNYSSELPLEAQKELTSYKEYLRYKYNK